MVCAFVAPSDADRMAGGAGYADSPIPRHAGN